jgi:YD repeat-containing protein
MGNRPQLNAQTNPVDERELTTSFGYDDHGNLISVTDPEGRITSYGYDILNKKVSTIDPQGNVTKNPGTQHHFMLNMTATIISQQLSKQKAMPLNVG